MLRLAISGCAALVLATSCVPQREDIAVSQHRRAPVDAPALLHQLALDVPEDLTPRSDRAAARGGVRRTSAPAFAIGDAASDDAIRARACLTAAVYYEARSEAVDGQRAVAQVVLNRVRDRAFPDSVCGVVYQGSTRRTGCQFSFTCDGSMDRPREPGAWARAEGIAASALAGLVYEPVGSATYYHAFSVLPWWAPSLSRIGAVGAHIFYRWRDGMERALAFRQSYAGHEPVIGGASSGPRAEVAGVAIHYGTQAATASLAGVTVHRGAAMTAVAASPSVAGVRVHFGKMLAGKMLDGTVAGEDGQAIVSQEGGPI